MFKAFKDKLDLIKLMSGSIENLKTLKVDFSNGKLNELKIEFYNSPGVKEGKISSMG
jgi:hypothetical protein